MNNQSIILDLDDTIFPTKTMDKEVFDSFFNNLTECLQVEHDSSQINDIINELWIRPIDYVFNKHNVKYGLVLSAFDFFKTADINLNINPYSDYSYLKSIPQTKFLVTTGIKNLQLAKIKALRIEKDFEEIFIIDPIIDNQPKSLVFKQIIENHNLLPSQIFVVGDNPDSEIKSGNDLQMITVQILRENIIKGDNANYYIHNFNELKSILDINHE
ncbi:HAD family hydrolase [Polaribacter sp. HL-MS24]|uniref:HAD family hydrolase n=1 Tax=Polaribacter sp. HL-MS24 TaxID=3077735 RepID=UPI00293505DF|nr:HAD family hydrolase [Polaribacter sp. HL-MS24]WOC40130.1 HAD family hydrolase [Polaribacter sp. HL-MS24]